MRSFIAMFCASKFCASNQRAKKQRVIACVAAWVVASLTVLLEAIPSAAVAQEIESIAESILEKLSELEGAQGAPFLSNKASQAGRYNAASRGIAGHHLTQRR